MTTQTENAKKAQGAKTATVGKKVEETTGNAPLALTEGNPPVKLEELIKRAHHIAKLVNNRETLISHLDRVNNLTTPGSAHDLEEEGSALVHIQLRDRDGNRYEISNSSLLLCLVIELKAQLRTKISHLESQLMA